MKSKDIHISDWLRILVGEVPISFFIELFIRAVIIYLILIISMRSMGKRMSSQLSRNELAALVSLAAAVGVPMMAPDRGLLPGVMIAIVIVCIQRITAKIAFNSQRFEQFSQGNISMLVSESVIDVKVLESVSLSRERLFAQLRSEGITHLGKVKRLYMEANGAFTLIKNENPGVGLCIIPDIDQDFMLDFQKDDKVHVCCFCGNTIQQLPIETVDKICTNCGHKDWTNGISDKI